VGVMRYTGSDRVRRPRTWSNPGADTTSDRGVSFQAVKVPTVSASL
jgi:hypothetical protein